MPFGVGTPVVAHPEKAQPPRWNEVVVEQAVEIGADLRARCPLVETRIRAGRVDAIVAERSRVHPVGRGRPVKPNERIGIQPVAAWSMTPIHNNHLGV